MRRSLIVVSATVALSTAIGALAAPAHAADGLEIRISVLSPSGTPAAGVEVVALATDAAARTDAHGRAVVHDPTGAWQSLAFTAALDA